MSGITSLWKEHLRPLEDTGIAILIIRSKSRHSSSCLYLQSLHNGLLHDDWPMPEAPHSPHQQGSGPSEFEGRVQAAAHHHQGVERHQPGDQWVRSAPLPALVVQDPRYAS